MHSFNEMWLISKALIIASLQPKREVETNQPHRKRTSCFHCATGSGGKAWDLGSPEFGFIFQFSNFLTVWFWSSCSILLSLSFFNCVTKCDNGWHLPFMIISHIKCNNPKWSPCLALAQCRPLFLSLRAVVGIKCEMSSPWHMAGVQ